MRELSRLELDIVSGGIVSNLFSVAGGVSGAIYGASFGAYVSAPIALTCFMFALVPDTGTWVEGMAVAVQVLTTGTVGGAVLGGAMGFMFGSTTGYFIEMLGL